MLQQCRQKYLVAPAIECRCRRFCHREVIVLHTLMILRAAKIAAVFATVGMQGALIMLESAEILTTVGAVMVQLALIVAQLADVIATFSILMIQRLTVVTDFSAVLSELGTLLCDARGVTASFVSVQLAQILIALPVVIRQFASRFADRAVVLPDFAAVLRDLTPVAADVALIVAYAPRAGLGVLRLAHIGTVTVTRSVAPILPEVAVTLMGVVYHGLGVYDGLNVYDWCDVLRICDRQRNSECGTDSQREQSFA